MVDVTYKVDELGRVVMHGPSPNGREVYSGGWLAFQDLALLDAPPTHKEWEMGACLASFAMRNGNQIVVAATAVDPQIEAAILAELGCIHWFNQDYYNQAKVVGGRFELERLPMSSDNGFATGVTAESFGRFFQRGDRVYTDRNDHRLDSFFGGEAFNRACFVANSKSEFSRLIAGMSGWHVPSVATIEELSVFDIDNLLQLDDQNLLDGFKQALQIQCPDFPWEKAFYFKIAGGAGGNAVVASITKVCFAEPDQNNFEEIRSILQGLRKRSSLDKKHRSVILTEAIEHDQYPDNPLDLQSSYISPCLTIRIGDEGKVVLGQVADQVLRDTTWTGNFWTRTLEGHFLDSVGIEQVQALGQKISSIGYRGYFGTDFVRSSETGKFHLILDANGRMNGNDMIFLVRKPLEKSGYPVDSAFLGSVKLELGSRSELQQALESRFGKYSYNPDQVSGLVLIPSLSGSAGKGEDQVGQTTIKLVYVNPQNNEEAFREFYGINFA